MNVSFARRIFSRRILSVSAGLILIAAPILATAAAADPYHDPDDVAAYQAYTAQYGQPMPPPGRYPAPPNFADRNQLEARLNYAESQYAQARRAGDERAAKHWKKQIKHLSRELSGGGYPHGSGPRRVGLHAAWWAVLWTAAVRLRATDAGKRAAGVSTTVLSANRLSSGRLSGGWLPLQRLPANGRSKRGISIWNRRFSLRRSRRCWTDGFDGRPWRAARSADGWGRCAFCGALWRLPAGSKRAISVWRSRRCRTDGFGGRPGALLGPLMGGALRLLRTPYGGYPQGAGLHTVPPALSDDGGGLVRCAGVNHDETASITMLLS